MNTELLRIIAYAINTLFMNILVYAWMKKAYGVHRSKTYMAISYVATSMVFILVTQFNIPIVNFIYGCINIVLISIIVFKQKSKISFIYNILYMMILLFCDILTVVVWTVIRGDTLSQVLDNNTYLAVSGSANIFIMYLCYRIFVSVVIKNESKRLNIKSLAIQIIFNLFALFNVYSYVFKVDSQRDGVTIIVIMMGFLILNFLLVYILQWIASVYEEQVKISMVEQQKNLNLEYYNTLSKKYEEARKIIHDIKKHMYALEGMKAIDSQKADDYGKMIEEQMSGLLNRFECSNQMLSVVMGQKLEEAKDAAIEVKVDVKELKIDFMKDIDITALFANLWDNAIEACKKLAEADRHIDIVLGQMNQFIIVCFENTFDGVLLKDRGNIVSTKQGHKGIGISIIKDVVEKYDGNASFKTENDRFIIEIVIPIV